MKHIIITHFNLKLWKTDKNKKPTQTKEWLDRRFQLFDEYCFPSVLAQTDKSFHWFCLFDIDTPDEYKVKIDHYRKRMPQFMPFFLTRDEATKNDDLYTRDRIKELFDESDEQVITSCLDNDDAIQEDFVKNLNEIARKETSPDAFVVFNYGYQYYTEFDFLMNLYYPSNHFPARIERDLKNFKTTRAVSHAHLRKKSVRKMSKVINMNNSSKPMWIEVIHEKNVANDVHVTFRPKDLLITVRTRPVLHQMDLVDFGLENNVAAGKQLYRYLRYYLPRSMKFIGSKIRKKIF